jgi:uncharacterized protein (DUF488 family)
MHILYTAGYTGLGPDQLKATAERLGAVVADIRYRPFSRNPAWSRVNVSKTLGERYVWINALGNRNYKGGPIVLDNVAVGIGLVGTLLVKQPVILLCVCPNVERCHRKTAAEKLAEALGCEVKHLTLDEMKANGGSTSSASAAPKARKPEQLSFLE